MEENRRFTVRELATRHGLTVWVVYKILTVDLGLVKKSARWVPKLLSPAQKEERVHLIEEFLKLIRQHSKWILGIIVTMDETAVSFHTPETKQQTKQWVKKASQAH